MKKVLFALLGAAVLTGTASAQTTIFEDDFESYVDTSAFDGSAEWTAGTTTISTAEALSGTQSLEDSGATAAVGGHAAVATGDVSSTNPLVVSFALFDDGVASPQRKGLSYGGYDGTPFGPTGLENFVALGIYTTTSGTNYSHRVVFGGGGWLEGSVARSAGWREMVVTFDGTNVTFDVDSVEAGTDTYTEPVNGYDAYRLGSFVGAADAQIYYDDFSVVLGTGSADVQNWHLY